MCCFGRLSGFCSQLGAVVYPNLVSNAVTDGFEGSVYGKQGRKSTSMQAMEKSRLLPGDPMGPMDGSNHSSWTARLPLETGGTWVVSPIWFTELLRTIILYLTESLPGRFYLRTVLGGRNPARRYSIDLAPSSFATAPHTKFEDWKSHWLHQKQYIIRMWFPTYAFSDVQSDSRFNVGIN